MIMLDESLGAFWKGLLPDKLGTVAEWAEDNRVLSQGSSKEYGPWSNDRTPYLIEPMEALSVTSEVQVVTLMFGAQLGKTELGNNFCGYVMDLGLGPMVAIQKTDMLAKRYVKQRVRPMIKDTPCLLEKMGDPTKRDGKNTLLHMEFEGGHLMVVNAEAAGGLRSMPVRFIFGDEVDSYPSDVEGEGDPCALAEARTNTFASRRKILWTSTPTTEGESKVEELFLDGDMRRYYVPCLHCGFMQILVWEGVRYDRDPQKRLIPDSVRYRCCECGTLIHEAEKTEMLSKGDWIPEVKDADPTVRSYHLSSLYSPVGWYSWVRAAKEYIASKGNQEKYKTWKNTVMGETWKQVGEVPSYERLFNQRETYALGVVPKGGVFLTMGVDVQKDRMEYEVTAWGPRLESWSIEYGIHMCDPTEDEWHSFFDDLRARKWEFEGGGSAQIRMACFDMGYQANHVYMYTRVNSHDTVAVQGKDNFPSIIGPERLVEVETRNGRKITKGVAIRYVGTDLAKSELYAFLRKEKPVDGPMPLGYCHFPQHPVEYFKQLTAEHLITTKNSKGRKVKKWVPVRERNEALDCRNYSRAAASIVGADRWSADEWKEQLRVIHEDDEPEYEEPKRTMHGRSKPWLSR